MNEPYDAHGHTGFALYSHGYARRWRQTDSGAWSEPEVQGTSPATELDDRIANLRQQLTQHDSDSGVARSMTESEKNP